MIKYNTDSSSYGDLRFVVIQNENITRICNLTLTRVSTTDIILFIKHS